MSRLDEGLPPCSDLEAEVMDVLWLRREMTADQVRRSLNEHDLTDSSVRTLLRRLEGKGYVKHRKEGRRYLYRPAIARGRAAAAAVDRVIAKVCGGAVDSLLVGMIEGGFVHRREIDRLRELLDEIESEGGEDDRA